MKRLMFSLLLFFPLLLNAQAVATATTSFSTAADLRLQAGTPNVQVLLQSLMTIGDGNGGIYTWNSTSTDADDNFATIKVTNVTNGRWKKMPNSNTIKGTITFSATVLTTAYNVNHGLPFTPNQVYIQARSPNAAVPSWVSVIDATKFVVNFASVPILGTNNITIDYLIIKL